MGVKALKGDSWKWLVSICLAAIFVFIPESGVFTYQVRAFFVVTVLFLALIGFDLINMIAAGILMPACWILFGIAPPAVVMGPWTTPTALMIVGALFMGATLEESGLLNRISYWLIYKMRGNYFFLLLSIAVTGFVINILTAGSAFLVLAPLAAGLCMSLNCMEKRLGAGIAMAVMLGGCTSHAFTYQTLAWGVINPMAAGYLASPVTPLSITLYTWPLALIVILMVFIVSKWYKPEPGQDLSDITYFKEKLDAMGPLTRREKWNAVMLVLAIASIFTYDLHHIPVELCFAIIPWMVYLPGINAAEPGTVKKMNVQIVFFVLACMGIGVVAGSLGLGAVFGGVIQGLLNGNTNPILIFVIIFAIVFVLNFLMTPMAIFALITGPVLALAVSMGFDPLPFALGINACSEAILLPYEYVPYLIVFAFGMISMKDFIKLNIMRSIVFFGGFLLVLVPYWMLIGLL